MRHPFRRLLSRNAAEREEAGPGPRLAVIGDDQARGIAEAMRILAPGAGVRWLPMAARADGLAGYDHVFSQPPPTAASPRMRVFPIVTFPAFHPDAMRIEGLLSPLGAFHSAIALFGHRCGLSVEAILPLYREEVFSRLGYLDAWDGAAAGVIASGRAVGFDLSPELLRWSRTGLFMHAPDRPRFSVLGDIAARLLREARVPIRTVPVDAYAPDPLLDGPVWPVYPAVATLYGAPGSYAFKPGQRPSASSRKVASGFRKKMMHHQRPSAALGLEAFVRGSLALYRKRAPAALDCQRLAKWETMPEIRALFRAPP